MGRAGSEGAGSVRRPRRAPARRPAPRGRSASRAARWRPGPRGSRRSSHFPPGRRPAGPGTTASAGGADRGDAAGGAIGRREPSPRGRGPRDQSGPVETRWPMIVAIPPRDPPPRRKPRRKLPRLPRQCKPIARDDSCVPHSPIPPASSRDPPHRNGILISDTTLRNMTPASQKLTSASYNPFRASGFTNTGDGS